MKHIKSTFLLTIFMSMVSTSSFAASPDDGDSFFVWTKGGTKAVVYSLDDLDKLTFEENALGVWKNNVKTSYAYDNISLLTFSERWNPTGIELPTVSSDGDVQIRYDRGAQSVTAESSKPLSALTAYDTQGRKVAQVQAKACKQQLSLSGLPRGVYIVKAKGAGNGKSIKIIK